MDLLQTGQKLSINIEKNDKLIEIITTINTVYDDRLELELPPYFMRYIEFLEVGRTITAKAFSKIGTIDFNSVIISSPLEEAFIIELDYNAMKLTPSEDIQVIDAIENIKITRNGESFIVRTSEISNEKMRIVSSTSLNEEENLDCELILPEDYGIISFKATVIEKDIIYDNEYILSCYAMSENDRQSLLYYMYVYSNSYSQQEQS